MDLSSKIYRDIVLKNPKFICPSIEKKEEKSVIFCMNGKRLIVFFFFSNRSNGAENTPGLLHARSYHRFSISNFSLHHLGLALKKNVLNKLIIFA